MKPTVVRPTQTTAKHVDKETRRAMVKASFDKAVGQYDGTLLKLSKN